ncbi:MAG TPA: MerR family transcriptional regulator [Actinomycetota bacterium]|nr:MerR family transcriptional regulator [Actinomycetota bacterium]
MNQMTIGEFSRASGLTRKALRLYADEGILPPDSIDKANGYRYYKPSQLRQATLVSIARALGMPLAEIKALLGDQPAEAHERLDRFWDQVTEQFGSARTALGRLHHAIGQQEEERTQMDVFEEGNRLYFHERDIEAALERYLEVEQSHPHYVTARRYIGHNVYGREWSRWQEGIPYLEEALRIAPGDAKVLEDIGRAYVAIGRNDEGRVHLEKAKTPVAQRALNQLS